MKTKRKFCVVIAICAMLLFSACSTEPEYYTEKQVIRYVNRVFGDAWGLDDSDQNQYTFSNEEGLAFTVTATTTKPITIDGASASIYKKAIRDDYFAAAYAYHEDTIETILEKTRCTC